MPPQTPTQTAADALVRLLQREGVDTVFGLISVHMLPVYDALQRNGSIRLVVPRHEQGAVHMADGYARASGRVGVALTSTGPGAANSMGAMLEAYTVRSPVLHLTSEVPSSQVGRRKGALHEAKDQEGMFDTVSDCVRLPRTAAAIPDTVQEAFNFLRRPAAGPAVVNLPIDLQSAPVESEDPTVAREDGALPPAPAADYDRAAALLRAARRPILIVGGGAVAAMTDPAARRTLITLAERLDAPVLITQEARGAFPEDHPLAIPWSFQSEAVGVLLAGSDAALALGTRFRATLTGDWTAAVPAALVHVDVNPERIHQNYPAAVGIIDDAARAIPALAERLAVAARPSAQGAQRVADARRAVRTAMETQHPLYVRLADLIRTALPRDGIVVADSTQTAYWGFSQVEPFSEPRSYFTPSNGAIGPALPTAIGAALGAPQRRVVAVAGDGGFLLNVGELAALAETGARVTVVVVNDGGYGVLRMMQDTAFGGRSIGVNLRQPDYAAVAEGFGIPARRVGAFDAFRVALGEALAADGPRLIEVDATRLDGGGARRMP